MVPHDEYDDEMFITDMGQVVNTIHPKFASSFDLFGVLGIEILEDIQLPLTLELPKNVVFYDDVLKVTISPVVVEFDHVDPQLSFDVLSVFVSHFEYVLAFSYKDLNIFFSICLALIMMMFPYVHLVHTDYMYLAYMMSPYNMIQMRMPFILIQVPHIR